MRFFGGSYNYLIALVLGGLVISAWIFFPKYNYLYPAFSKNTTFGKSVFKLLAYRQYAGRCTDVGKENLYLFFSNTNDADEIAKLFRNFKPANGCRSLALVQNNQTIDTAWTSKIYFDRNGFRFPKNAIAQCDWNGEWFSIVPIVNGLGNGTAKRFLVDGRLTLEENLKNNLRDGICTIYHKKYTIKQIWRGDKLVVSDTTLLNFEGKH